MQSLSSSERAIVRWAVGLAAANRMNVRPGSQVASWRYCSVGELLIDLGRLFTPGPAVVEHGPATACYASARADACDDEVYVEGLAILSPLTALSVEHAWCAAGGVAVDPTWTDGAAYLGIAFEDRYRQQRQHDTGHHSLLWSPAAMDLLRDGPPATAVVEIGRPIPLEMVTALS